MLTFFILQHHHSPFFKTWHIIKIYVHKVYSRMSVHQIAQIYLYISILIYIRQGRSRKWKSLPAAFVRIIIYLFLSFFFFMLWSFDFYKRISIWNVLLSEGKIVWCLSKLDEGQSYLSYLYLCAICRRDVPTDFFFSVRLMRKFRFLLFLLLKKSYYQFSK